MEFRRRAQDVETAVASQRDEQWAIYPTRTSGYSLSFSIACVRMRLATLARNTRKDAPRERQTDKLPNGGKCDWAPGTDDALARKVAVAGIFNR